MTIRQIADIGIIRWSHKIVIFSMLKKLEKGIHKINKKQQTIKSNRQIGKTTKYNNLKLTMK